MKFSLEHRRHRIFGALLVVPILVLFSGCPLSQSFTIIVSNETDLVDITRVYLVSEDLEDQITQSIVFFPVTSGESRRIVVYFSNAGEAGGIGVEYRENENGEEGIATAAIDSGFDPGDEFEVTAEEVKEGIFDFVIREIE
ncbi:MAG: hypothetical protein SGI88_17690 [Candidatus Hydrogenedentes bacterium]|nr:hypothetical protein [Candidatus Hydrogenedentota bacterium]